MTEYRSAHEIEVRADGEAKGRITITPMPYGVLDSYRTRFRPGCFADFLQRSAPVFAWMHDDDPIGQMVDYDDTAERLRMNMQLDDFDAVPRARQAFAQLSRSPVTGRPTLRNVSVGFERKEWEPMDDDSVDFVRCDLPEVSVVMAGAVPGADVNGVRSAGMMASVEAISILVRLDKREITLDEALTLLYDERASAGMHAHAKRDGGGVTRHSHAGGGAMHSHPGLMPMMTGSGLIGEGKAADDAETRDEVDPEDVTPQQPAEVTAALDIAARYR